MASPVHSGPLLEGQELDNEVGLVFPFLQQTMRPENVGTLTPNVDVTPINRHLSLVKTFNPDETSVKAYVATLDTTERIRGNFFPDILVSAAVIWVNQSGDGDATADPTFTLGTAGITSTTTGSANASATIDGEFSMVIREGYEGLIPTKLWIFFLPIAEVSSTNIQAKTGASPWPVIRLSTKTISVFGQRAMVRKSATVRYSNPLSGFVYNDTIAQAVDRDGGLIVKTINLPPVLNSLITISQSGTNPITATASVTAFATTTIATATATGTLSSTTIPATTPTVFPTGNYIYDVNVQLYKYGYARISALTMDVTSDYV